ncbi:MAG: hypothetical protein ACYDCQ_10535 [Dehalococcoidia bacterium]
MRRVTMRSSHFLRRVLVYSILVFAAVVLDRTPALAHAPIYLGTDATSPDTAAPLGDPASPGLVYGTLAPNGAQYLRFTISDGQPFHVMVLGPLRDGAFTPALALVGAGLGDPSGAPFAVPDGDGVFYVPQPDQQMPIFLPDLGLRFLAGANFDGPLPQAGDYFLVVYSADGSSGDYTLGTGYGP